MQEASSTDNTTSDLRAISVDDEAMAPWREPGELIYLDPDREPAIGDHALIVMDPGAASPPNPDAVFGMVRKLIGRTATAVELQQYDPPSRFTLPLARIVRLHRVIEWSEMLAGAA